MFACSLSFSLFRPNIDAQNVFLALQQDRGTTPTYRGRGPRGAGIGLAENLRYDISRGHSGGPIVSGERIYRYAKSFLGNRKATIEIGSKVRTFHAAPRTPYFLRYSLTWP